MYSTNLFIVAAATIVSVASGNPYVISDARARVIDITPTLGRGYSIMTNSFQSICLTVGEMTIPSYNYDYSFYDFTSSTTTESTLTRALYDSAAFGRSKELFSQTTTTKSETKSRLITSVMRIERYYSSVKDESATLTNDAQILLERQDYIGFFKACGPNFIRGIRRAQEVTANLMFESASDESATQYKNAVATTRWSTPDWYQGVKGKDTSESMTTESNSLSIDIVGFGLGLSYDGSETFVARSIDEYLNVMKFAFKSMTSYKGSYDIGMVYGFEVTPWIESIAFQVASNVGEETIENPLPLSLIPRSFLITKNDDFTFNSTQRELSMCQDPSYQIDMYGYCCEESALYDRSTGTYISTEPELRVCRPLRQLEPFEMKDNLALNGEFVARLDQAVRFRLNQLSGLENCVSAVRGIPERYDFHILAPQETVQYDSAMDIKMSVFEMKVALDPFNDYQMVTHMAKEFDEYMEMFVQPCYAALFGSTIGNTPDTDTSFLMAYPWYTHDECSKLSCFGNSMRWDRNEKACVPSLITGSTATAFTDGDSCVKKLNSNGDAFECKYTTTELGKMQQDMQPYWDKVVPQGRIDYFMSHFCLPQLSGEELSAEDAANLVKTYDQVRLNLSDEVSVNVALRKPAVQSCTHHHYPWTTGAAGNAVDGNDDRAIWHGSTTRTCWTTNNYWQVDLQDDYYITHVDVIKSDRWHTRIDGITVKFYDSAGTELASLVDTPNIVESHELHYRRIFSNGGDTSMKTKTTSAVRKVRLIANPSYRWTFDLAEVRVYALVPVY